MAITPLYAFDEETRRMLIKLHLEDRGGIATGPVEGAYGEVYSVDFPQNTFPRRLAAKCPRIRRFGTSEQAREGIEQVLHELEKTHQVFMVPWINRFADVRIIHGWPFIVSRYRDGTLEDLISNPLAWSVQDRFASLIQITRALRMSADRGISAHQDLKPANILFDDLRPRFVGLSESKGLHFHMFVGDFGIANAFRDFGRNSGSRPYMAPEQFGAEAIDPAIVRLDVFALGVIAFECFNDGLHPMGVVTADVWPWQPGMPQRWNRESTWRRWATSREKILPTSDHPMPLGISELIQVALCPDPLARCSLEDFELGLWSALMNYDGETFAALRMQVDYLEGLSSSDTEWPYMDERLMQLRAFYSAA